MSVSIGITIGGIAHEPGHKGQNVKPRTNCKAECGKRQSRNFRAERTRPAALGDGSAFVLADLKGVGPEFELKQETLAPSLNLIQLSETCLQSC